MSLQHLPTTREIAAACGCNQSTVSHALNGNPKISEATRKRIVAIAERMGWRPNPLAAAYMSHLRTTRPPAYQAGLGFLLSSEKEVTIDSLPIYLQRHFRGASARARELGYSVDPVWVHEPGMSGRRLTSLLYNRGIRGLIIPSILKPTTVFDDLDWRLFASVALGFSLPRPELHRVAVNTTHGFDLVLRRAMELGYRRIGVMISNDYDLKVNHGVYYPVYYIQQECAKTHRIDLYSFPEPNEESMAGIAKWITEHKPEVILGEDIVWRTLRRMEWNVSGDVGFISVDWSPEFPEIGGFNQRHESHGSVAVDFTVSQILKNERGLPSIPRSVLVKGCWADGMSVPPAAERPFVKVAVNR